MYQARGMVQSQSVPHLPRQHVGMIDHMHDRPQSPDEESFLASLCRSIECHFNPEQIVQNDVLQAILTCYQGCYPLQLVIANQNFQMYIAHCAEMNLPIVTTFLRALEHSRFISATEDQMFIYLVPSPPQQHMAAPANTIGQTYPDVASGPSTQSPQGFYGTTNGMANTMMPGGGDNNVQELASINCKPQVVNAQNYYMTHHQYHQVNCSESPTSVFEAFPEQAQPVNGFFVRGDGNYGDEYSYGDDKQPQVFVQQGSVPTMFVPTAAFVSPRPTRRSKVPHGSPTVVPTAQPPTNGSVYHEPTIPSPSDTAVAAPTCTEEGETKPIKGPKPTNKKRNKHSARKKKKNNPSINESSTPHPPTVSSDAPEAVGIEHKVAELSIAQGDNN